MKHIVPIVCLLLLSCVGGSTFEIEKQSEQSNGSPPIGSPPNSNPASSGPTNSLAPIIGGLMIASSDNSSIRVQKPTLTVPNSDGLTVQAFIGYLGQITVQNSTVLDSLQGPIDSLNSGPNFTGLMDGKSFRIIIVAKNAHGYSVAAIDMDIPKLLTKWFCYYNYTVPSNRGNSVTLDLSASAVRYGNEKYTNVYMDYVNRIMILRRYYDGQYYRLEWNGLAAESVNLTEPRGAYPSISSALAGEAYMQYRCVKKPETGVLRTYCPDNVTTKETFPFVNQSFSGTGVEHDCTTGLKAKETPYVNDEITGLVTSFCDSGAISMTEAYTNSMKNGLTKYFNCANGKVYYSISYANNLYHGYTIYYCPNGVSLNYRYTYNMGTGVGFESFTCP